MFKEFIIFMSFILIHELGHYIVSLYYGWKVKKIAFYPFGGTIKFDENINRPIKEEFNILLGGPIMQVIYYLLFFFLYEHGLIMPNTFYLIRNYHLSILIFNLLPLYPLDGAKLLNLILSHYLPYKTAHKVTLYISYFVLLFALLIMRFVTFNINIFLLIILLFFKLLEETKNHHSIYNRFLLERYLYNFDFKKIKVIIGANIKKMMRDRKHFFTFNKKITSEKNILRHFFKK